jgi:hypothetical protein
MRTKNVGDITAVIRNVCTSRVALPLRPVILSSRFALVPYCLLPKKEPKKCSPQSFCPH